MTQPLSDDELRAAFSAEAGLASHRADCPSPDALLAAIRGEGTAAERQRTVDLALRCPACRQEMALLKSVSGPPARVSAASVAWRRAMPMALAATVLLAVGLAIKSRLGPTDITRAGEGGLPALVAPAAAAPLTAPTDFIWHAVPGALGYTFEMDAGDGTVLRSQPTTDTLVRVTLEGIPAGEHRWFVTVRKDDGSTQRSEVRALKVVRR